MNIEEEAKNLLKNLDWNLTNTDSKYDAVIEFMRSFDQDPFYKNFPGYDKESFIRACERALEILIERLD